MQEDALLLRLFTAGLRSPVYMERSTVIEPPADGRLACVSPRIVPCARGVRRRLWRMARSKRPMLSGRGAARGQLAAQDRRSAVLR